MILKKPIFPKTKNPVGNKGKRERSLYFVLFMRFSRYSRPNISQFYIHGPYQKPIRFSWLYIWRWGRKYNGVDIWIFEPRSCKPNQISNWFNETFFFEILMRLKGNGIKRRKYLEKLHSSKRRKKSLLKDFIVNES